MLSLCANYMLCSLYWGRWRSEVSFITERLNAFVNYLLEGKKKSSMSLRRTVLTDWNPFYVCSLCWPSVSVVIRGHSRPQRNLYENTLGQEFLSHLLCIHMPWYKKVHVVFDLETQKAIHLANLGNFCEEVYLLQETEPLSPPICSSVFPPSVLHTVVSHVLAFQKNSRGALC